MPVNICVLLFELTVDPEEVLAAQEKQRLSLLKGLSRSIKEVCG